MNRRSFLENTTKAGFGTLAITSGLSVLESCGSAKKVSGVAVYAGSPNFQQRALPYAYKSLEPNIDAATMEIHFSKHAAAYTKNMNDAIAAEAIPQGSLDALLANISRYSVKLRNNAGGHYNHESFWSWMTPNGKLMSNAFTQAIETAFGSVNDMKNKFTDAGMKTFGSGWAWLVVDANKKLVIGSTPNQDNPLMDVSEFKGFPILGLDVWEHAYYIKYQNKRADYINAWWNIVNWQEVENRYNFAIAR
ncbi:MAG: superoxide dismutase [Bacteroidota bacterium]